MSDCLLSVSRFSSPSYKEGVYTAHPSRRDEDPIILSCCQCSFPSDRMVCVHTHLSLHRELRDCLVFLAFRRKGRDKKNRIEGLHRENTLLVTLLHSTRSALHSEMISMYPNKRNMMSPEKPAQEVSERAVKTTPGFRLTQHWHLHRRNFEGQARAPPRPMRSESTEKNTPGGTDARTRILCVVIGKLTARSISRCPSEASPSRKL